MYIQVQTVQGKQRLRIINSSGYRSDLNCQGPKSIRVSGAIYKINNPKVSLMQKPGARPFYKLPNNASVYELVGNKQLAISKQDLLDMGLKIYE